MELTAYHGTISKHERSIKEKGLDPEATFHRKDHWLGQGVYFFVVGKITAQKESCLPCSGLLRSNCRNR